MAKLKPLSEVLRYTETKRDNGKVRRYYKVFRKENGIPERCDKPGCKFGTEPLVWNGKPLPLILDHVDGCSDNNDPNNLRFLCPICDAQSERTRGGANKGRIRERGPVGYAVVERGSEDRHIKVFEYLQGSDNVSAAFPVRKVP